MTSVALPPGPLVHVMRQKVCALQKALEQLPQYEPATKHHFHAGMYCREVYRDAGVLVVGKVHRKEHFYVICSGRVMVTDGENEPVEQVAPAVIKSVPGTKRAVLSLEPTVCMTFHVTNATTVEDAERELVEDEPSTFGVGNKLKVLEIES
jgi:hypothetical protein